MSSFKKIYVFCPNDFVTGGPDALHQIVYYLNQIGLDATIVYYAFTKKHVYAIPDTYKKYISDFITEDDYVDSPENIAILPEQAVDKLNHLRNSKVYIWWLSVDNNTKRSSFCWKVFFFATLLARVVKNWHYYKKRFGEAIVKTLQMKQYDFNAEPQNVNHLCASHYAYDFVSKRSKRKIYLCIEPISKIFLEKFDEQKGLLNSVQRSNVILYNPRKSGAFVQKLSEIASDLDFVPLKGLNQEELIEMYKTSKLYVDFGPFPGAERIPKEAALFGCCVITGRNGASDFYGDVPIPDEYKFANYAQQVDLVVAKIRDVLKNYEAKKSDFDEYRKMVITLEGNFKNSLKGCLQNG